MRVSGSVPNIGEKALNRINIVPDHKEFIIIDMNIQINVQIWTEVSPIKEN